MLILTLITRRDCGLCEEMAEIVGAELEAFGAAIETVDVDSDPDLVERYGLEVPVLLVNGRKAFKYRVTARDLRQRLQSEQRRAGG
jgi:hypothetical protein